MSDSPPESEIQDRTARFQERLQLAGLDGALMVQKTDIYYLSGTDQDAHLWVPASGAPLLMVRKSLSRATEDSPLENIVALPGFSGLPGLIQGSGASMPARIGLEMDILPASFYFTYGRLFPEAEFVDISSMIRGVRMVKSPYEISCLERGAAMADSMYRQVPRFLEESSTDTELALRIEAYYRSKGHPGLIRTRGFNMECVYGQVMCGKGAARASNAPGPTGGKGAGSFYSQGSGNQVIRRHEPIIIDHAANVEGYVADQARIFSLGKPDSRLQRAHEVMLEIQEVVSQKGVPSARAGDLYDTALGIAEKEGLSEGFMGYPDPVPFVAHGLGLEIDEWPILGRGSDTLLEEGMVVALEPKYIAPGEGVVGIENTFLVEAGGMRKLNRFPDAIYVC